MKPRVSDADLALFQPQYKAALEILRRHRLGMPLEDLAGLLTLKVVAMTWEQVTSADPELPGASRG